MGNLLTHPRSSFNHKNWQNIDLKEIISYIFKKSFWCHGYLSIG